MLHVISSHYYYPVFLFSFYNDTTNTFETYRKQGYVHKLLHSVNFFLASTKILVSYVADDQDEDEEASESNEQSSDEEKQMDQSPASNSPVSSKFYRLFYIPPSKLCY